MWGSVRRMIVVRFWWMVRRKLSAAVLVLVVMRTRMVATMILMLQLQILIMVDCVPSRRIVSKTTYTTIGTFARITAPDSNVAFVESTHATRKMHWNAMNITFVKNFTLMITKVMPMSAGEEHPIRLPQPRKTAAPTTTPTHTSTRASKMPSTRSAASRVTIPATTRGSRPAMPSAPTTSAASPPMVPRAIVAIRSEMMFAMPIRNAWCCWVK
mmetsp:Transcript_14135/g.25770  ORF Transcript_14135/g.25770 Transcript_14135/m.25770 type:complete len:213 (+) Transcript_14135:1179-1817(+)